MKLCPVQAIASNEWLDLSPCLVVTVGAMRSRVRIPAARAMWIIFRLFGVCVW